MSQKAKNLHPVRLLPLLVFVAFMSFAVRMVDVVAGVRTMEQAMLASATAQVKIDDIAEISETVPSTERHDDPVTLLLDEDWIDPSIMDISDNSELLGELAERRKLLDSREISLNQREALVRAAEKQVEEKINQLTQLRSEIEILLGKQTEEEIARLRSLVKVYEGMKAKDAAVIFNTLDMEILVQVIERMSERKIAPILAEMDPQRARKLTVILAEQKKLPSLPQ